MNTYVVAIYSFLKKENKQFIIKADSEFFAIKKGLIELAKSECKEGEEYSKDYPFVKTVEDVYKTHVDLSISIIQIP